MTATVQCVASPIHGLAHPDIFRARPASLIHSLPSLSRALPTHATDACSPVCPWYTVWYGMVWYMYVREIPARRTAWLRVVVSLGPVDIVLVSIIPETWTPSSKTTPVFSLPPAVCGLHPATGPCSRNMGCLSHTSHACSSIYSSDTTLCTLNLVGMDTWSGMRLVQGSSKNIRGAVLNNGNRTIYAHLPNNGHESNRQYILQASCRTAQSIISLTRIKRLSL